MASWQHFVRLLSLYLIPCPDRHSGRRCYTWPPEQPLARHSGQNSPLPSCHLGRSWPVLPAGKHNQRESWELPKLGDYGGWGQSQGPDQGSASRTRGLELIALCIKTAKHPKPTAGKRKEAQRGRCSPPLPVLSYTYRGSPAGKGWGTVSACYGTRPFYPQVQNETCSCLGKEFH